TYLSAPATSHISTHSLHDALPISYNKALEIYNGTGEAVDLADYRLELYSNGAGSPSQHVDLSGELEHGEVFVIAHGNAAEEILRSEEHTSELQSRFDRVCRRLREQ